MKSILEIFPRASQSMIDANPQLYTTQAEKSDSNATVSTAKTKRRGVMNATEQEYWLILKDMISRGEILRAEFEGITLRWADMRYTPDFVVFPPFSIDGENPVAEVVRMKLIEVKGGHIWDRDIVRFKGARAYWPEFAFEMHQKKAGLWKRIH